MAPAYTFRPVDQSRAVGGQAGLDQLALKLAAVKPYRQTHRRPDAGALERQGAAALLGYQTDAKRTPCRVRTFYTSMGGEVLVCDSEPMTHAACERAIGSTYSHMSWVLGTAIVQADQTVTDGTTVALPLAVRADLALAECKRIHSDWDDLRHHEQNRVRDIQFKRTPDVARAVVFPSQRSEPVEVTETPEVAPESAQRSLVDIMGSVRSMLSEIRADLNAMLAVAA